MDLLKEAWLGCVDATRGLTKQIGRLLLIETASQHKDQWVPKTFKILGWCKLASGFLPVHRTCSSSPLIFQSVSLSGLSTASQNYGNCWDMLRPAEIIGYPEVEEGMSTAGVWGYSFVFVKQNFMEWLSPVRANLELDNNQFICFVLEATCSVAGHIKGKVISGPVFLVSIMMKAVCCLRNLITNTALLLNPQNSSRRQHSQPLVWDLLLKVCTKYWLVFSKKARSTTVRFVQASL